MWQRLELWKKWTTVVLAILGVLAILAGIIYITLPAKSIPHFFPDYTPHSHFHANKHGAVAIVVGVILIVVAVLIPIISRRADREEESAAPSSE
jgi:uncharacterized membrane protein HdeD (DUF308 family)